MAWLRDEPGTNDALESAPVRGNFQAIDEALAGINLCPDPNFLIWPAGDAAAPAGCAISGTGASIARSAGTFKAGGMAPQLTLGTATARLTRPLMVAIDPSLRGKAISFGAYVNTVTAGLAKLEIDDGFSTPTVSTTFHTGGGGWEWMIVTKVLDASATKLDISGLCDIAGAAGNAFFDQWTVVMGPIPPQFPKPGLLRKGRLVYPVAGEVAVATDKFRFLGGDPFIVRNVGLRLGTVNTGAAFIVDVNHWDGATFSSMFATRPQIAAAASPANAGANPDGTYRFRCFDAHKNAETITDKQLSVDIDQVGSTIAGSDLEIFISTVQYDNPLADLEAF